MVGVYKGRLVELLKTVDYNHRNELIAKEIHKLPYLIK